MSQSPAGATRPTPRRARQSFAALTTGDLPRPVGAKAQRTSKTHQKLVVLPSAPQTKPLPRVRSDDEDADDGDDELGYETDAGRVRSAKSAGERWSKSERERRGCKRIAAYCFGDGLKARALAGFLRREHNVVPRVFDEAIYAVCISSLTTLGIFLTHGCMQMYHLPLLPGYGPGASVRSSAPVQSEGKHSHTALDAAEEAGYQGTYFAPADAEPAPPLDEHGYIASSPPTSRLPASASGQTDYTQTDAEMTEVEDAGLHTETEGERPPPIKRTFVAPPTPAPSEAVGEAVFFEYGVAVFFGLAAEQERAVLADLGGAGLVARALGEDEWEVEAVHFALEPGAPHPRIYNDFFTLKSGSHLLKLSIAHAFAQSTLLARYEAAALRVLRAPRTAAIPRQLAASGAMKLRRKEALKLTGTLFALRRDVNLLGHVLDVPELFWSEASLKELYDAVREYMEIDRRVEALNEKLGVANDLVRVPRGWSGRARF
jgi:uncharacterized Rmd1/YagE family protein